MQCLSLNVIVSLAMFCGSHLWHYPVSETLDDGNIINKEVDIPFGRRNRLSNAYDLYNKGNTESTEVFCAEGAH